MSAIVGACVALACAFQQGSPVAYTGFVFAKRGYHAVTVDIPSGRVAASVVSAPKLTSVWKMVGESQPVVAVTGTFFDRRSQRPVADVLVNGALRSRGARGTAVAVDWYGAVSIFDKPFRASIDWDSYQHGLRGAVRVISRGKVCPNPKAQRFRDKGIWGRAARTGLGLTSHGKLMLFATREKVTLSEFGRAMHSRGIVDAVSLDGGGSTCLYYKGSLVVPPNRKLNNLFVVSLKPAGQPIAPPADAGDTALTPDIFSRYPTSQIGTRTGPATPKR